MTTADPDPAVLFVDTCSLLLPIELATGPTTHIEELTAALAVIGAAVHQPDRITIAQPDVVATEYARRLPIVIQTTRDHLAGVRNSVSHISEAAVALGLDPVLADDRSWHEELGPAASEAVERSLDLAHTYEYSSADSERASARQAASLAPAVRGSRDALIVETALRIATERPLPGDYYFLSHNTEDYCEGRYLHRDLVDDFDAADLRFVRTWRELRGRLRL